MVKKKTNEIVEEELSDLGEDGEGENKKLPPQSFDESLDELEGDKPEKTLEVLFEELDKRMVRLEKSMVILKQWLKKNSEDIERNTENFKTYIDQK